VITRKRTQQSIWHHSPSQSITTRCTLLIVIIIVFQYIKQMVPTASHLDHKVMDLVSSRSQEMLLLLLAILVGADSGSQCIQSFQLVGSFIHKFGTKGSSKGQLNVSCNRISFGSYGTGNSRFDCPRDIAIAPNGSVYISDMYNNRIAMY